MHGCPILRSFIANRGPRRALLLAGVEKDGNVCAIPWLLLLSLFVLLSIDPKLCHSDPERSRTGLAHFCEVRSRRACPELAEGTCGCSCRCLFWIGVIGVNGVRFFSSPQD